MVWAVALVALVGLYVAVYPSVQGNSSFARLINQMPKTYRALFTTGSGADFSSPAGYLNTELLTFMGPLIVLVYAVVSGSGAVAAEEERHTLDLLLANPIGRGRMLLEKFGALVVGTVFLMVVLWAALVVEGTAAGMDLSLLRTGAALSHLGLLGIEFGAVALLVGALTGHATASRAVPAFLAVVAYLLNALAPLVGWLEPLRKGSPFYQYIGNDPLRNGLSAAALGIALATIAVLVALSVTAFRRRDILA